MLIKVNSVAEFNQLIKSDKTVVVDFYADWCGPCRMLAPYLDQIATETPEQVVAKVDVDALGALAGTYGVNSIPTIVFFKNGKEVERSIGFKPKDYFVKTISRLG